MAEQRERSGLFFAWDPLPPADEEQYTLGQQQYTEAEQGYGDSWRQRRQYLSEGHGTEQGSAEDGAAVEGQA